MISGLKDRHESQLKQEEEETKAMVLSRPRRTHGSVKKEEAVLVKLENLKKEDKHQTDLDDEISEMELVDKDDVAEVVSPETRPRECTHSSREPNNYRTSYLLDIDAMHLAPEITIPRSRLVVRVEIPYRPNRFQSFGEGSSTRRTSLKRGLETTKAQENITSQPRTRAATKKQKVVQNHPPNGGGMETKLLGDKYKCNHCRANGLDCEVIIEGYSLLQSHWLNASSFSRCRNSRCRSCKVSTGARRCLFPFMEKKLAQRAAARLSTALPLTLTGTRSGLQFRRDRLLSINPGSSTSGSAPGTAVSQNHGSTNAPGAHPALSSSSLSVSAPAVRSGVDTPSTSRRRRRGLPPSNPHPKPNFSAHRPTPPPTPVNQPVSASKSAPSASSQIISQDPGHGNADTSEINGFTPLNLDPSLPADETVALLRGLLAQSQETTRVVASLLERLDAR
ncbi:unnamed protein product [Cyclocybe aegerita]|uniref:Uncharacterized protein n=1 Tax=Cyclocybe aegerita TaxID=1973307 RepID=A0A8S0XHG4_CYCAE|nr:unnamed protein product [Cyclocybe aegerita]